jgi:hypothetical protein
MWNSITNRSVCAAVADPNSSKNPQTEIRLDDLSWHFPEQRSTDILRQLVANGLDFWEAIGSAGYEIIRQVTDREAASTLLRLVGTMSNPAELECFHPAGLLRLVDGKTSEYAPGARLCPHPILVRRASESAGPPRRIKILHCSDTHEERYSVHLGEHYDIFIFSGDFSPQHMILQENSPGVEAHIRRFNTWLGQIPATHRVVVGGNHDMVFETWGPARVAAALTNATAYLCDSCVVLEGICIWGSPWITLGGGGFERHRAPAHPWRSIPADRSVDILVTHSPPGGIMDIHPSAVDVTSGAPECGVCKQTHAPNHHWGDREMRSEIFSRLRPALHCFGHSHESPGIGRKRGIVFSNAAYTHGLVFDLVVK